jgi:4-amino-4-deoxy-L-arabinose transferase-like glycosyltransferase
LNTLNVPDRRPWLYVLIGILPMLGFWQTGLFDLDEGFYGAIAAEMNLRGEWITPYYAGKPWFEKPILIYWLSKPMLWLFGVDFGPRLASVLCSLISLVLVSRFARRHFGDGAANLASLILGGSLLFALPGQMMLTDAPLLLALTGAWLTFWDSLDTPSIRWKFGFWLGVSVLAKGPVGILLSIPLLATTYALIPQKRDGFRGGWPFFWIALACVTASWYVPAYIVNGEIFVQKFLIEQNLNRFTGGDAAHTIGGVQSFLFFVPVLLVGTAPWWWFALENFRSTEETRFLGIWTVVVFGFFTLSGAKLLHYIMPVVPAIALVASHALRDRYEFGLRLAGGCVAISSLVAWVGFPIYYEQSGQKTAHNMIRSIGDGPEPLLLYQMGRREKDRGTGSLNLRETSLPSLRMYSKRKTFDVESYEDLRRVSIPAFLFTRQSRKIGTEDWILAEEIFPVLLSDPDLPYRMYRLEKGIKSRGER